MYTASENRYETMPYFRCGRSGLKLPAVSLGFWHNFGDTGSFKNMEQICFTAFDHGITHFDLANNYGPEPGSAECNLGRILRENFRPYRDELTITWLTVAYYLEKKGVITLRNAAEAKKRVEAYYNA